ncbi:MAG: phosphatidylglycerophosphatase A [Proteobacteria bacterium]|nr:phosphatidylglycerophosphatase A [Pseudomonadota bacterium]
MSNILNRFYLLWATGFFTGFIPKAPGTIGSLVGILLFLLINFLEIKIQILIFLLYFLISLKSVAYTIRYFNKNDPSEVNCDEIIGIWIALLFFQPKTLIIILAFIFFRTFDILKPFPVRNFENFHGPFGVIADDIVAGLLTKGVVWLIMKIFY